MGRFSFAFQGLVTTSSTPDSHVGGWRYLGVMRANGWQALKNLTRPERGQEGFVGLLRSLVISGVAAVMALAALVILPDSFFAETRYVNSILSFGLVAIFSLVLIRIFDISVGEYFRLPRVSKPSLLSIAVVVVLVVPQIFLVDRESKSIMTGLLAIVFVFSVGLGEELFARGFIYGYLKKRGNYLALVLSSLIFGLMHLNRYIGEDWDGWKAYSHVISAFGFGLLACALMIVTRSIWIPVIFHALSNWDLAFKRESRGWAQDVFSEYFLGRVFMPSAPLILYGGLAFFILWFNSGFKTSPKVERIAAKLKLVDSNS
jgi:uncharacterized protein